MNTNDKLIDKNTFMAALFAGNGLPSTNESNVPQGENTIKELPVDSLNDFHTGGNHPFPVEDDEDMESLVDNIQENGILTPILARIEVQGYEIITGHRRVHAAKRLGIETVPVIVMDYDDEMAIKLMVLDNLEKRTEIKPSVKARAYAMYMDANKRQGQRGDLTSCPVGTKSRTDAEAAQEFNESARNIQRYIRLLSLVPELLEMVDNGQMKFRVGVELSYLTKTEQSLLLDVMICDRVKPSIDQALELKKMSKEGRQLTTDLIHIFLRKDTDTGGFTAGYITKLLPKEIRKLSAAKKQSFTANAIAFYSKHLEQHPDEQQQYYNKENLHG